MQSPTPTPIVQSAVVRAVKPEIDGRIDEFVAANRERRGRHPTGARLLPARDRLPHEGAAFGVVLVGPVVGPIPRLSGGDRLFVLSPGSNRKERRRQAKEMRRAT